MFVLISICLSSGFVSKSAMVHLLSNTVTVGFAPATTMLGAVVKPSMSVSVGLLLDVRSVAVLTRAISLTLLLPPIKGCAMGEEGSILLESGATAEGTRLTFRLGAFCPVD